METTDLHFFTEEWHIENFTCWNPRIHGVGIVHKNVIVDKLNFRLELYPHGRNGCVGDRMIARVYDETRSIDGELSFVCNDGTVLCRLEPRDWVGCYSVVPTELEFGEIVERSVRGDPSHRDVLTLRYRRRKSFDVVFRVRNRIDVIDTTVRIPQPFSNGKRSSILNFLLPDGRLVPLQFLVSTSATGRSDFEFMLLNLLKNNNHASNNNNHFFVRSCVYLLDESSGVVAFQENEHLFLNLQTWNFASSPEGVSLLVRLKFVTGGKSENYTGCWFQPHQLDVTMSEESLWFNPQSNDFTTSSRFATLSSDDEKTTGQLEELATVSSQDKVTTGQLEEQDTMSYHDKVTIGKLEELATIIPCDIVTSFQLEEQATMSHHDKLTTGKLVELATMIPCDIVTTGQREEQATMISCDEKTTGQLEELCTVSFGDEVTTGLLEELAKESYHNKVTTDQEEELAAVSFHDKMTTGQPEELATMSPCDKVTSGKLEEFAAVSYHDKVTTGHLEELSTMNFCGEVTTGKLEELATVCSQDQVTTGPLEELPIVSSCDKVTTGQSEELATMSYHDKVITGQLEELVTISSQDQVISGQLDELATMSYHDKVITNQLHDLSTMSSCDKVTTGQLEELVTVSSQDQVISGQLDELATISSQNKVISGWLEELATMTSCDEVTTTTGQLEGLSTAGSCIKETTGQHEEYTTTSSHLDEATTQVVKQQEPLYEEDIYNAFSDLQLRCEGETFVAHRAVLSAHSSVFRALLLSSGDAPVRHVDIQDLDATTLCQFLFYLYTGGTADDDLQWEEALKLYRAAHLYQVPSLAAECSTSLTSSLDVLNVCDVLTLAEEFGDEHLASPALDFVLKNYARVVDSEEWRRLRKKDEHLLRKTLTKLADKVMVEEIFSDI